MRLRASIALAALLATSAGTAASQRAFVDTAAHRVTRIGVAPDVRLEVLDWGGTGPALVFLGGFSYTGHVFDTFAPRFTDRFRVVTLTRRGLGNSDRPNPGPYDAPTLAADVKTVLDSLGIQKVILAGWSFGGTEASYFAAAYPDRTEKIVYIDSYCGPCGGTVRRGRPPLRPSAPPLEDRDTLTPRGIAAFQRRTLGFAFPEAELRLITNYGRDGRVRPAVPDYVWQALGRGVAHPGFAKIQAPVLGIFAERATVEQEFWWSRRLNTAARSLAQVYVDVVTENRRAMQDQFERQMPRARAAMIPGGHHALFLSHPDETERLMRDFLLAPTDSAR
ncbi:MAG TPA: alpha/beta hydrolase [Longimicrobium sp.]|nr:alpha/beta hydrolase [Longimicrobium sp.]